MYNKSGINDILIRSIISNTT